MALTRPPVEAEIRFAALAAASFPKLVVSGGHSDAFEAVCDVLETRLDAERIVIPGRGVSSVQGASARRSTMLLADSWGGGGVTRSS